MQMSAAGSSAAFPEVGTSDVANSPEYDEASEETVFAGDRELHAREVNICVCVCDRYSRTIAVSSLCVMELALVIPTSAALRELLIGSVIELTAHPVFVPGSLVNAS